MGSGSDHERGPTLIIETYLKGDELSLHIIHDGYTSVVFPSAQDHKTIGEDGVGDNTGGMGVIAPVPGYSLRDCQLLARDVATPIFSTLASHQKTFTGCLYPGLKITDEGYYVLEYNARFGDPEAQVYMRLLESDLVELLYRASVNLLRGFELRWKQQSAATVVIASAGYPNTYNKGYRISGIEDAETIPGVLVFHMGTRRDSNGLRTDGGRVLGVSALGDTLADALARAYSAVETIHFDGMYFRRDIGKKYR
jgi:phosphoribosylamine--glycine ligase